MFGQIHRAEIALARLLPPAEVDARLPEAAARLCQVLPDANDPRRALVDRALSRLVQAEDSVTDQAVVQREALVSALRVGFDLADQHYARVRNFRNVVIVTVALLTVIAIGVVVIGALHPNALGLCFGVDQRSTDNPPACPTRAGNGTQPTGGDVALVALLGALGATLSAAGAIRKLHGSHISYGLSTSLAVLKLPTGALAATVGLVLIRGEFVPGLSQLDNQGQIMAYAVVFGLAQQLVTRLIDQQACAVLGSITPTQTAQTSVDHASANP